MPKKILFISSTSISANPRLLKELLYASSLNIEIDCIGFRIGNWSDKADEQLRKNINAKFIFLSATRQHFFKWFFSSLLEKTFHFFWIFTKKNIKVTAFSNKRTILIHQYLKRHKKKYDLIVSHTLPTLYPAYKFAKQTKTKFTFDIEDFHPGETCARKEAYRRKLLMNRILPHAEFVSYASPLIGVHSLELSNNNLKKHILINNCFSEKEFQYKENSSIKVKFVWFSQNIAQGRGLEQILPILEIFKDKIEFHIIGNLYSDFYENVISNYSQFVILHKPMLQKDLNLKLSEFDIGLAIELNDADFNRQICLTNKIWSYMQSGLYILATDTPAQIQFMNMHNNCGLISEQTNTGLQHSINEIINNITGIRFNKKLRYEYAKDFSWENEKTKLNSFYLE